MTTDTDWRTLIAEVPREPFLPDVIWTDGPGRSFVPVSRADDPQRWEELTAGDQAVITQVDDGELALGAPGVIPTSSASMPSVVARMLDEAEIAPGHRVLEIGTGTGWNAALLARRVGDHGRATSVEVDPEVADQARQALAVVGADVEVITGDGEDGYPPGAPYDRVLATVGARTIPQAWIAQTAPGGLVIAPWGTDYSGGTLLRLRVQTDGKAAGELATGYAFMRLRAQRRHLANADGTELDTPSANHSVTDLSGPDLYRMISADEAAFTIGLQVPGCRLLYEEDRRGEGHHVVELHDVDSKSWALVDVDLARAGGFDVYQRGPRRLWNEAVAGYRWWQDHGRPDVSDFQVTVTPDEHLVQMDGPDGMHRWSVGAPSGT